MTSRKAWLCCGLAIVILGSCSGLLGYRMARGWSPSQVKRFACGACPLGTPQAEVKAWLDTNPFSECLVNYDEPAPFELFNYPDDITISRTDVRTFIAKDIPHANVDLLFSGEIELYFFFDLQDRLILVYVREWVRGL